MVFQFMLQTRISIIQRFSQMPKIVRKISIVEYIKIKCLSVRETNNCSLHKNEKKKSEIHLDKDRSEIEEQRGSTGQNNSNQTDCRCRSEFCSMQRSLGETRRMEKKKRKKTARPGERGRTKRTRGSDNHPIQRLANPKWTNTDARARASSELNLVSDCSRLFLVRRNAVHKSHVSPIRVGPHFHLHLYPDADRWN